MYGRFARFAPLLALGCGTVVGGTYRGEVMLEIEGDVFVESPLALDSAVGVAVLWTKGGAETSRYQTATVDTSFPARYRLRLYRPPDRSTRVRLMGHEGIEASIGTIVLFEDRDGDGRWAGAEAEPIVGGAFDSAVVWVDDPDALREVLGPAAQAGIPDSPVWAGIPWAPSPGFQLVEVPIPPVCGLPLDAILFQRPDNRVTLYVGGLRSATYDWDCDGAADFDSAHPEEPATLPDCGPPESLEQECLFLESTLTDEMYADPVVIYAYDEQWWLDCLAEVCPETVEHFLDIYEEPTTLPAP